jgi:hypothetical protein
MPVNTAHFCCSVATGGSRWFSSAHMGQERGRGIIAKVEGRMSGVYLIVWDEALGAQSNVLQPTKGGWPHLTLAWTGKHLPREILVTIAGLCFPYWAMRTIVLTKAYVNSFQENGGAMRHDVLLEVSADIVDDIEKTRESYLKPHDHSEQFAMRKPHITHSIHATAEDAQVIVERLNELSMPYRVAVTGVSID